MNIIIILCYLLLATFTIDARSISLVEEPKPTPAKDVEKIFEKYQYSISIDTVDTRYPVKKYYEVSDTIKVGKTSLSLVQEVKKYDSGNIKWSRSFKRYSQFVEVTEKGFFDRVDSLLQYEKIFVNSYIYLHRKFNESSDSLFEYSYWNSDATKIEKVDTKDDHTFSKSKE